MFQVWLFDAATDVGIGVMHLPGVPREGDAVSAYGEDCTVARVCVKWGAYPADTTIEARVRPQNNSDKEWWK